LFIVNVVYKLPIDLHFALGSAFVYCKFEKLINNSNNEAFNVYSFKIIGTALGCIVVVIEIGT